MSFPTGQSNGATTTIKGVVYTYNSTSGSWSVITGGSTSGLLTASSMNVSGNTTLSGVVATNATFTTSSISNASITNAIITNLTANGSVGTAGQVLSSNGTTTYWATASSVAGTDTQIQFNDAGAANGSAAYTFNKSTNNVYVANSIGINVATPLSKVDISGTAVRNYTAMAAGTAGSMDLLLGQVFTKTVTAGTTFSIINTPSTRSTTVTLYLTNGGTQTLVWTNIKWPGGSAPTFTSSGLDVIVFSTVDGGTTWQGNIFGKDVR